MSLILNLLNHMLSVRIVEAKVNGIPLWRVYVNQNVEATFPTYETALKYAKDRSSFKQNEMKTNQFEKLPELFWDNEEESLSAIVYDASLDPMTILFNGSGSITIKTESLSFIDLDEHVFDTIKKLIDQAEDMYDEIGENDEEDN